MQDIKFGEKIKISSISEMEIFCQKLAKFLGSRAVLLLQGTMGSGKTKTVELLLRALGNKDQEVASPTFGLHHQYKCQIDGAPLLVDHFDLYRVEDDSELETVGLWESFLKSNGWILIEWPERIDRSHLPTDWPTFILQIQFAEDSDALPTSQSASRTVQVTPLDFY